MVIVDGQQRLTSLYAVIKGTEVLRATFKKERIQIAFNPLTGKFDVADVAIKKDRTFIPDISVLWEKGFAAREFRESYINKLREVREVANEEASRL